MSSCARASMVVAATKVRVRQARRIVQIAAGFPPGPSSKRKPSANLWIADKPDFRPTWKDWRL